jgi:hypothetical protein
MTATIMPAETPDYWWQYDASNTSMMHMETGEQVFFRGEVDLRYRLLPNQDPGKSAAAGHRQGWYRFDYVLEDQQYPILVGMGHLAYPTPDQARHLFMPEGEYRPGPRMDGWVWIVDHNHSARLWGMENATGDPPTCNLWSRADRAIIATALLWHGERWKPRWQNPQRKEGAALEVAMRGGWINGDWRHDLQRRIGTDENLLGDSYSRILPLSVLDAQPSNQMEGRWERVDCGALPVGNWGIRNPSTGTLAKVILLENAQGDSVKMSFTDKKTGVTTVSFPGLGTLTRKFVIEIQNDKDTV